MAASTPSTTATSQQSHSCAPDPYLTEDRLASIFEDFTAEILRFTPSYTVFTHLVNNVRSPYMSQLLQQQQVIDDRSSQYELQLAAAQEQQLAEVAELRAEHARQMSELIESHACQRSTGWSDRTIVPRGWISGIEVTYGNEGGDDYSDRIQELDGNSNEINYFHGGRCVWLMPKYQDEPTGAMTSIEIDIQPKSDGRRNLAQGARGDFRYLKLKFSLFHDKIHTVNLLRLGRAIVGLPEGFTGRSGDINRGRGNDYLYLIWKAGPGKVGRSPEVDW